MFAHTNIDTKFSPFTLDLSGGRKVTGIQICPPSPVWLPSSGKPLMIALHGATCFSGYWDLDAEHSASIAASALGVPFAAVDRPGYFGTDAVALESASYQLATAKWIEHEIIPLLWHTYGVPNGCSSVCLMCHSLGCLVGITVASLHANGSSHRSYPLAGLIISGVGKRLRRTASVIDNPEELEIDTLPPICGRAVEEQTTFMLAAPELQLYDKAIVPALPIQTGTMTREELWGGIMFMVTKAGVPFIESVKCSVLHGLAEHDAAAFGTPDEAKKCAEMFKSSRRVDSSVIRNAPHAIEWSKAGAGWYFQAFGWALEVAADLTILQQQWWHLN